MKIAFFVMLLQLFSSVYADSLKLSFLKTDFTDTQTDAINSVQGAALEYYHVVGNGHGGANESAIISTLSYSKDDTLEVLHPKIRWIETKKMKDYDVALFTSFAYRTWRKDTVKNNLAYFEAYKFSYADFGIQAVFHEKDWHLGFELGYQRAINFSEPNTHGTKIVVPLRYDINKNTSIELAYEDEKWNLNQLKSKTTKLGIIIKW